MTAKQFGLKTDQVLELRRMYIIDKFRNSVHNAGTQSLALKELKNIKPNVILVITYADPAKGHDGTIYKAANAIYLGRGNGNNGKHKYIFLLGNKHENKTIMSIINTMGDR